MEGDTMLERKSYLCVLASTAIAAATVGSAIAQPAKGKAAVSDQLREKCRAQSSRGWHSWT
jgi:hypothetical protein